MRQSRYKRQRPLISVSKRQRPCTSRVTVRYQLKAHPPQRVASVCRSYLPLIATDRPKIISCLLNSNHCANFFVAREFSDNPICHYWNVLVTINAFELNQHLAKNTLLSTHEQPNERKNAKYFAYTYLRMSINRKNQVKIHLQIGIVGLVQLLLACIIERPLYVYIRFWWAAIHCHIFV